MKYRVLIDARAAKQLEKLSKSAAERIDTAIVALSEDPRPTGVKMLRGKLKPGWRVRVGDYRVLYRIDDRAGDVRIFEIGHRRRNLSVDAPICAQNESERALPKLDALLVSSEQLAPSLSDPSSPCN